MVYWIKRISRIVALLAFFAVFLCGIDLHDPFNAANAGIAFAKAFLGAFLLWMTAFVICDIVLKGAVEDIPAHEIEVLEGGIMQRIHTTKSEKRVVDKKAVNAPPEEQKKTTAKGDRKKK